MRKQLVIGVSLLTLTGLGGVRANSVQEQSQEAVSTYVHFVRTCQNQTFEPLSGASLAIGLPNRSKYQTAGVHFIVSNQGADFGNDDAKNNDFSDPAGETCKNLGYTVTSCETGLFNKACPYNDALYDRCCDVTYKYTSSQCSSPKKLSSDSCGGKYRCYCDTATYPYASCNSPQIKGNSCTDDSGTRYATCTCPSANNGQWGCKEYYAAPCNSICKTPYTDSCHLHESVSTPYGCEKYFEGCSSKCEVAYKDNCRNQTAVITSCPTNANCTYFADCKSKVQSWSCKSGFVKSGNSCVNPCDLRTAVISSCPANATCSYFSDCSSKIQSWSCNSGYNKSENKCLLNQAELPILYSDGTVTKDILSNGYPIGVVIDETNRLAVAVHDINREGKETSTTEMWSRGMTSAAYFFCMYNSVTSCDFTSQTPPTCGAYGQNNTTKILNDSQIVTAFNGTKTICKNVAYAALGCFNYEPSRCETDFCKKTKWFLPSMNELVLISQQKAKINKTMENLNYGKTLGYGRIIKEGLYCSSNKADEYNGWRLNMTNNSYSKDLVYSYCFIRPVVYY